MVKSERGEKKQKKMRSKKANESDVGPKYRAVRKAKNRMARLSRKKNRSA